MLALSACSTTSPQQAPQLINIPVAPREAPAEYVIKCPTELPSAEILESQWNNLSPEGQWDYVKSNIGKAWSSEYFKCAVRHNSMVDWYMDQ